MYDIISTLNWSFRLRPNNDNGDNNDGNDGHVIIKPTFYHKQLSNSTTRNSRMTGMVQWYIILIVLNVLADSKYNITSVVGWRGRGMIFCFKQATLSRFKENAQTVSDISVIRSEFFSESVTQIEAKCYRSPLYTVSWDFRSVFPPFPNFQLFFFFFNFPNFF